MISVDVFDSDEAAEYASIVHDDAALDEDHGSGLVGEDVIEGVRYMHKYLESSYISSYMLKPFHLLT